MRTHRVAACAGIFCFLLALIELLGPSLPMTGDSATSIDTYFVAHRSWMLVAVAAQGLGNVVWTVFVCLLAWIVAKVGSATGALIGLVGGLLNIAVSLTGLACIAALAYGIAGQGDPELSKSVFVIASMTLVVSNGMLALMAGGFAASSGLPQAFRVFTAVAAVVFLIGSAATAQHGALSPDGAVQFATYLIELVWTLAASILLLRDVPARTSRVRAREDDVHGHAGVGVGGQA